AQGEQRARRRNREESMRRRTVELAVVLVAAMGVTAWGGTRVPPLQTKGGAPAEDGALEGRRYIGSGEAPSGEKFKGEGAGLSAGGGPKRAPTTPAMTVGALLRW